MLKFDEYIKCNIFMTIPYRCEGSLNNYSVSDAVKSSLKFNGIAIIENFIDTKIVDIINTSIDKDLSQKEYVVNEKNSIMRIYSRKDIQLRKEMRELVTSDLYRELAEWFYRTQKLNYDAMAHIDYPGEIANSKFHSDPTIGIKFYIHLNDIGTDLGAMKYCLGSHLEGYLRLKYEISKGSLTNTFGYKDNDSFKMGYRKIIDVSSNKGSLIIFNTAGLHSAGYNKTNGNRRILRFQYSPKINLKTKVTRIIRRRRRRTNRITRRIRSRRRIGRRR